MNDRPASNRALVAVVIAISAICVYSVRQVDADMYGYLAYGRLFLQRDSPAVVDPFAYTSGGTTWVAFEYLAQIALWMSYAAAGPLGLIALKCVLGGVALYGLSIAARAGSDEPLVWIPAFLIGASAASRYFLFRPQLFTFALFAVFVAVVVREVVGRRTALWLLPIVMLPWANAHGGFVAGLGVIALGVLLSLSRADGMASARRLAITLLACLATTMLNPRGLGLWRYVLTELTHNTNRQHIAEWQPAFSGADPWSAAVLVFITVAIAALTIPLVKQRARIVGVPAWAWAASSVPLLVMSYTSVRHVPLAAMWAVPVIALVGNELRKTSEHVFKPVWLAISSASLVPIALTVHFVVLNPWPEINADGRLLGFTNTCRAVEFIRANGIKGSVYNPLSWGSYLTWETYPEVRVSMDGRNISAFPREAVEENLRFYSSSPAARDVEIPLRVQSDYLLVPTTVPMARTMRGDVRWKVVYEDSDALLFARAEKVTGPLTQSGARCSAVLQPLAAR